MFAKCSAPKQSKCGRRPHLLVHIHVVKYCPRRLVASCLVKGILCSRRENSLSQKKITERKFKFPSQDVLALSAFRCQAYTRALMYLESFLSTNLAALQKNLGFLQVSYIPSYESYMNYEEQLVNRTLLEGTL